MIPFSNAQILITHLEKKQKKILREVNYSATRYFNFGTITTLVFFRHSEYISAHFVIFLRCGIMLVLTGAILEINVSLVDMNCFTLPAMVKLEISYLSFQSTVFP